MELNIRELFRLVLTKWWIILICAVIFGIGGYVYSQNFVVPVYEANTTLYVGKNADEKGVSEIDLDIGTIVVQDYREIAKSRLVASTVINELGITHLDADSLMKKIKVEQRADTRVIEISFADTSPEMAMIITNKAAEVLREKIIDIMQIKNVQVIDAAIMPTEPISLSSKAIMVIMLFVGSIVGGLIIFLMEYLNNTIKTSEDVKRHLGLPVLGAIPSFKVDKKEI
ncbi:MAG TPA: hypothetical protein GXX26_00980 [Clostridiaceae bacterium]|nr:hypothetical protein [Clostridiaceae bacterium]